MNAKKSRRNFVTRRSTSSKGVAQRREYARNYIRIGNAIDEVLEKYWGRDAHRHFSGAIMAIVRELIGCRITEISDSNIDGALACVKATHHLIKKFQWHVTCEGYRREREEREQKEREQRDAASSAAMNRIMSSLRSAIGTDERPSNAPVLSLVHDCGRNLVPPGSSPSPGPYSA